MAEKIKGMFGSVERAEEVKVWLLSQGAINDTQIECVDVHSIYYVDNGKIKTLFSLYGAYDALFDIVELPKPKHEFKPFDRVLVRELNTQAWRCDIFSHKTITSSYACMNNIWSQCIPYEGNEHLLGTNNKPKE